MKKMGNHFKAHKVLYSILGILLIVGAVLFCVMGLPYIRRHYTTASVIRAQATAAEPIDMAGHKGIIVYFTRVGNTNFDPDVDAVSSASLMEENGTLIGNSELLSEMIGNATGFERYAITVEDKYSSSYGATVSEAREENSSGKIRTLTDDIPDFSEYDTIFLIYPLWWWTLPQPVRTFLTETDLAGKTIYPVVTHGGSKFGSALSDMEKYTEAEISRNALEVYDDDVREALPDVTGWLKSLSI